MFNSKLKEDVRLINDALEYEYHQEKRFKRLDSIHKKLNELSTKIDSLYFCEECGHAFKARYTEYVPYYAATSIYATEERYCKSCAPKVEKRNKAIEIAKKHPDKVIKCAGKK